MRKVPYFGSTYADSDPAQACRDWNRRPCGSVLAIPPKMDPADPNNPCRWSPDRGLSLRVHVRKLSDLESHDKCSMDFLLIAIGVSEQRSEGPVRAGSELMPGGNVAGVDSPQRASGVPSCRERTKENFSPVIAAFSELGVVPPSTMWS